MADRGLSPPKSAAETEREAKAREHELAEESRRGGAPVFEFDPNAAPEQKAAQVKKVIYYDSSEVTCFWLLVE